MSEIRTYAEAAEWLPREIREHIEVTVPCLSGGRHNWRHDRTELRRFGDVAPVQVYEFWVCTGCGTSTETDPAAIERLVDCE